MGGGSCVGGNGVRDRREGCRNGVEGREFCEWKGEGEVGVCVRCEERGRDGVVAVVVGGVVNGLSQWVVFGFGGVSFVGRSWCGIGERLECVGVAGGEERRDGAVVDWFGDCGWRKELWGCGGLVCVGLVWGVDGVCGLGVGGRGLRDRDGFGVVGCGFSGRRGG